MKKLIVLIVLLIISFSIYPRPNPQKQTAEVLNDVMNTAENALQVSTVSGYPLSVTLGGTLSLGASMDFSDTNLSNTAYATVTTLTADMKQIQITNNSGGSLVLRVDSTDVGVIAPGLIALMGFEYDSASVISVKSGGAAVTSGILYLNFIE